MSSEIGRKIRCDRCGAECFLKLRNPEETGRVYITDDKFEDKPSDWGHVPGWTGKGYVDLCPNCHGEYTEMIRAFMGAKK